MYRLEMMSYAGKLPAQPPPCRVGKAPDERRMLNTSPVRPRYSGDDGRNDSGFALYKVRWLQLAIFCLLVLVNAAFWVGQRFPKEKARGVLWNLIGQRREGGYFDFSTLVQVALAPLAPKSASEFFRVSESIAS